MTSVDGYKNAYVAAGAGGSTHVLPPSADPAGSSARALLLLGRGSDADSERGVDCPGELPAASDPDLVERARAAKAALGDKVFILGHHYQRDEVIQFADVTGDSFKLARDAAARPDADYIVFCGVHFMAESADILTGDNQRVLLPDLAAGCSMADMARDFQVHDCWDVLADAGVAEQTVPVTYMNSSAAIKAFTGEHGGLVCTPSRTTCERGARSSHRGARRARPRRPQHRCRRFANSAKSRPRRASRTASPPAPRPRAGLVRSPPRSRTPRR